MRVIMLTLFALSLGAVPAGAWAQAPAKKAAAPAPAASPTAYDDFVKGAEVVPGLIGVIRKNGAVYLAISTSQLGTDFVQTAVPATGLGGFGPAAGEPYVAPARIMRFERVGNAVAIRWPNTFAKVDADTPQARGAALSLPGSIVAVTPVVAESPTTVVISAAPFLGDVADFLAQFNAAAPHPGHTYHLDESRSFFTASKAFAQNTVLRVAQTWATDAPDTIDNAPDPRSVEVDVTYNIIAAPHDGYMPRIADDRIGYFELPMIDFQHDRYPTRNLYYISRWNFMPEQPGAASPAKNPIVFTLSNDIPVEYRDPVRRALLAWNAALAKVGILDAIRVQQQPSDPTFDPDDIRNNMVRWIDATSPQYGAEALIINDPRTGEEINVGVNVDAVEGLAGRVYRYFVAPARGLPDSVALEQKYAADNLYGVVLHESGHDLGLQHNFIGSMAYTAADLQSKTFTSKYGIATSVMEYTPVNVWPKGTPNGDYHQMVLGPYDYYAVRYGYGTVPGATTPEAELPTLSHWASKWPDPLYRFASDEDVDFAGGHAIDPRVQQDDLTDHPVAWEKTQLIMLHGVLDAVDQRFPKPGQSYSEARRAFLLPLQLYMRDAVMPAHVIGGEYLSRADAGDPHAAVPLQPVPRADELAAWQVLQTYLFSDSAWHFRPDVLDRLTYSEVSSLGPDMKWAYDPSPRHDVAVVEMAAQTQTRVLDELFAPLTLQRIDDLSTKYAPGTTMSLADLFDWTRNGIFGDVASGGVARDGVVRRNLQVLFAKRLAQLWVAPAKETPSDAQALARLQLVDLSGACSSALRRDLDELSRAHVEALQAIADQALQARATIAAP
ncbi:MAG TPA: zinc-dependent metalloprotease [Verrucomicrobiae bacterium]|nr:zinc-dependent metalloprotease [Verrucomicrobiae bacterium]